jgi:SpoVK/Ycf46/Vps4 family AAA+-type ATPase
MLEGQLGQIFQIAKHWGAVLLLDEADVYLEHRSNQDLVRNSLVSVFLRKLEYCEGIMFLTTNRVSQFDEAVLSRIHLTLRYDDLNKATREQIWRQFLCRACNRHGPAAVRHSELEGLAATKFNGHQARIHQISKILVLTVALRPIKNIVATAHALATKQGSCV